MLGGWCKNLVTACCCLLSLLPLPDRSSSEECFIQSVGVWVGLWTLDRKPPPPVWGVYLGCWPGCVKQSWDESWEVLWTARHLKVETHSWKSSVGLKLAKYCSPLLPVFVLLPLLHYYTHTPCRLFTAGPDPALERYLQVCRSKRSQWLRMCFAWCGCAWTKGNIPKRKYGNNNHMLAEQLFIGERMSWKGSVEKSSLELQSDSRHCTLQVLHVHRLGSADISHLF